MASHLTALGFPVSTEGDFRHYTYQASEFGQTIEAPSGAYTVWAPGYGIELWVQTNLHKRIIGMSPHFSGCARMRILLTRRITRRDHSILDGTFYSWANPTKDSPTTGAYPFLFDAPDYNLHKELALPCIADVQLAAFAHTLQGYDSEEAFSQAQSADIHFAPESFVPSGLFSHSPQSGPNGSYQALAMISGHVLTTKKIINPITGQQFYWALIRTLGGKIDVVADPQVVQGKFVVNGIVRGTFWLSGKLHLHDAPKESN